MVICNENKYFISFADLPSRPPCNGGHGAVSALINLTRKGESRNVALNVQIGIYELIIRESSIYRSMADEVN